MSYLEVNFTSIHKKVKFFNKINVQLKTLFQLLYQQPGRRTPQAAVIHFNGVSQKSSPPTPQFPLEPCTPWRRESRDPQQIFLQNAQNCSI